MSQVSIILGSESDMKAVEESGMLGVFDEIGISWELSIISAHRNPDQLKEYCLKTLKGDTMVYIGIAGMSAALPGVITSYIGATKPVIGVPLASDVLDGQDSLFSMVRMPPGMPVSVCGIGKSGLYNSAIMACQIIADIDTVVKKSLQEFVKNHNKPAKIGFQSSKRSK